MHVHLPRAPLVQGYAAIRCKGKARITRVACENPDIYLQYGNNMMEYGTPRPVRTDRAMSGHKTMKRAAHQARRACSARGNPRQKRAEEAPGEVPAAVARPRRPWRGSAAATSAEPLPLSLCPALGAPGSATLERGLSDSTRCDTRSCNREPQHEPYTCIP